MFKDILDILNSPESAGLIKILVAAIAYFLVRATTQIQNRIRLAELKHVATIHALQLQFKNGFHKSYEDKLDELIRDSRYIKGK